MRKHSRIIILIAALLVLVALAAVPALAETIAPQQPAPSGPCVGGAAADAPCVTSDGQPPCAQGAPAQAPAQGACPGPGSMMGGGGCGGAGGCGMAPAAAAAGTL